jgi:hypothetical protein
MKVKELIKALKSANPEAEVILQKDAEGNGYSPLSCVDFDAVYEQNSTWRGEVFSMEWSADDACKTVKDWAEIKSRPRCVVLAPMN